MVFLVSQFFFFTHSHFSCIFMNFQWKKLALLVLSLCGRIFSSSSRIQNKITPSSLMNRSNYSLLGFLYLKLTHVVVNIVYICLNSENSRINIYTKSIPLTLLLLFYFKSIKNNNNNKYGHFHLSMCVCMYDGHKNWHSIWFQFLFLLSISYHIIYSIYACLWYHYLVNFFSLLYQIDDDDEKFQEFFWLRETKKKTDMKIPLKRVKKKLLIMVVMVVVVSGIFFLWRQ